MFSYGLLHMGTPVLATQLCADTGCSQEDLPRAMADRDGWLEDDIKTFTFFNFLFEYFLPIFPEFTNELIATSKI